MISIRMWVESNRIVSARMCRFLSVTEIRERYAANDAPRSVGEFMVDLNNGLIERMSGILHSLEEEVDALEEMAASESPSVVRPQLPVSFDLLQFHDA
jgi:zinc transporter